MSYKMTFLKKLSLALSCFLPLYLVFFAKNLMAALDACQIVKSSSFFAGQNEVFRFNAVLTIWWLLLMVVSVIGIYFFTRVLEGKETKSTETVEVLEAENITADYYFSYFSLFVLSFYGVDPTTWMDIAIFTFLELLLLWVYLVNDMYFINPILNLLGYRSFLVTYKHKAMQEYVSEQEDDTCLECRAFSRKRLNKCRNETFEMLYSNLDFTVCIPEQEK